MAEKTTLTQKLLEVSKAIEYLEKDKTNKMQGYKYLSEAKIKDVIKKQFEAQGIVFNYSTTDVREYEISSTSKGTKQFVTIANGTYQFLDVDSDKVITGTWFGSGTDTGDKGLYKAITGGIKYVLNTNFLIPTGDDPENDEHPNGKPEPKQTKPADNYTELKKQLMKKYNGDAVKAKAEFDKLMAGQKEIDAKNELEKELANVSL